MFSPATSSTFLRSPSPPLKTISGNHSPPPPSTRIRPAAVGQLAPCLYEVLGIPMGASGEEIKAAYRRLARTCHPDVAEGSPADEFVRINAAYSTLSDPEKRADYDRMILRRNRPYGIVSSSPMAGYSGYTGRNWETDQCW